MSRQECAICDNPSCGGHAAMQDIASNFGPGVERIPEGWFAKRQSSGLETSWLTYCSAICVALGEGSPPLLERPEPLVLGGAKYDEVEPLDVRPAEYDVVEPS
jgi:hypothetical protein